MSNYISDATRAMAECISLTLASDDDGETKAKDLAESFQQMQDYLTKNATGDDGESASDHPAIQIADLLVNAGRFPNRAAAVDHLLHTTEGATTLRRHVMTKEAPMTKDQLEAKRSDVLKTLGKDVMTVAKSIVAHEFNPGLDEHDFTAAVTSYAQSLYPNDRADTAFAKVFAAEEVIRRAHAIVKSMPIQVTLDPRVTSGDGVFQDTLSNTESSQAYAQLKELGRQKWPTASEATQFANAFTDPANAKLAAAVHQRPSATTSYPFPR
jgi:hypothetical protein